MNTNFSASMRLYSEETCIYSHRVRLLLSEKNIAYELELVDADDKPEDLIHLNPYNSLPTLVDRDLVLYDARVITDYLDERYPHPAFLPLDPVSRAKVRLVLYRIEKDWYSLLPGLVAGNDSDKTSARNTLRDSITASADLFAAGTFFLNDEFSLLDTVVAPLLWRLPVYGVELPGAAKAVADYAQRIFARPRFQSSLTEAELEMRSGLVNQ